jgi:hypothetical protein
MEKTGHFLQPTASATGQIVITFSGISGWIAVSEPDTALT